MAFCVLRSRLGLPIIGNYGSKRNKSEKQKIVWPLIKVVERGDSKYQQNAQ